MALGTPWRIHAVLPRSAANGPGLRFVIWSQGRTLACPGCFHQREVIERLRSWLRDGRAQSASSAAALARSGWNWTN